MGSIPATKMDPLPGKAPSESIRKRGGFGEAIDLRRKILKSFGPGPVSVFAGKLSLVRAPDSSKMSWAKLISEAGGPGGRGFKSLRAHLLKVFLIFTAWKTPLCKGEMAGGIPPATSSEKQNTLQSRKCFTQSRVLCTHFMD